MRLINYPTLIMAAAAALAGTVMVNVVPEVVLLEPKSSTQTAGLVSAAPVGPAAEGVEL